RGGCHRRAAGGHQRAGRCLAGLWRRSHRHAGDRANDLAENPDRYRQGRGVSDPDLAALLEPVKQITREAGAVILEFYREGFSVEGKADGSPVTAADRAADDLIVARLQALAPDIPVVSEESHA